MERLNIHVALEVCEIVIETATLMPIAFAVSCLPIDVAQFPLALLIRSLPLTQLSGLAFYLIASPHFFIRPENLVDEKRTRFLKHLIEFRCRYFSNRVKNDAVLNGEKALRANEPRLRELAAFKVAAS
jgi:hypothetical protein